MHRFNNLIFHPFKSDGNYKENAKINKILASEEHMGIWSFAFFSISGGQQATQIMKMHTDHEMPISTKSKLHGAECFCKTCVLFESYCDFICIDEIIESIILKFHAAYEFLHISDESCSSR